MDGGSLLQFMLVSKALYGPALREWKDSTSTLDELISYIPQSLIVRWFPLVLMLDHSTSPSRLFL